MPVHQSIRRLFLTAACVVIWLGLGTLIPAAATTIQAKPQTFAIGHFGLRAAGNWPLYHTSLFQVDWGAGLGVDYASGFTHHGQIAFSGGDGGLVTAGELRYSAGFWAPRPKFRFGGYGGIEVGYANFEIGCGIDQQPYRTVAVCGLPEGQLIERQRTHAPKAGGLLGLGLRRGPLALAVEGSLDAMLASLVTPPDYSARMPDAVGPIPVKHLQTLYWDSDLTLRLIAYFY